jgi:hypothetical protein
MAVELTYWLPPSEVKQSAKTTIAGPILRSCTSRATRSGTLSPNGFQLTCARPEPVKPTRSYSTGKRRPRPPFYGGAFVVLRRQEHRQLTTMRVAQRIVGEHPRIVLQNDDRARRRGVRLRVHRQLLNSSVPRQRFAPQRQAYSSFTLRVMRPSYCSR